MPEYKTCDMLDFGCHTDNLLAALERFFSWIWGGLMDFLGGMLALIPVPDFIQTATFALPDGVAWFASALEIPTGLSIVVSAYLIRFTIRRLPFIG